MRRSIWLTMTAMALCAMLTIADAKVRFLSTFKSMDAGSVVFVGKKVAAAVITDDDSLRMSGEEALVRELTSRGLESVATYRIAPKEELRKAETAKVWFERAGVEGVVVLKPIAAGQRTAYTSGTWVSPYYSTFYGYWGSTWGSVYIPGSARQETVITVESIIYSVTKNELLWAAVTETSDPENLQEFVKELVKESVKQLHEQGLARRVTR
jgi:hypothetical protein